MVSTLKHLSLFIDQLTEDYRQKHWYFSGFGFYFLMIIYNLLKHSKIEACAVLTTQATSLTENYKEMYMETALANLDSRYYGIACGHFI